MQRFVSKTSPSATAPRLSRITRIFEGSIKYCDTDTIAKNGTKDAINACCHLVSSDSHAQLHGLAPMVSLTSCMTAHHIRNIRCMYHRLLLQSGCTLCLWLSSDHVVCWHTSTNSAGCIFQGCFQFFILFLKTAYKTGTIEESNILKVPR